MAHIENEKIYDKKVNFSCLLIAIVLLALAAFACITTFAEFEILGFYTGSLTGTDHGSIGVVNLANIGLDLIDDEFEVLADAIEADPTIVVKMIFYVIVAIMQLVALIHVVSLALGLPGFLGKKDSRKVAKKLSKYAKSAFGIIASVFVIHMYTSFDNGKFSDDAKTLFVLTFIVAGVLYVATRYYRWFVVEKETYKYYTFVLIRDAIFVGLCIMIYSVFVNPTVIGDFINAFANLIPATESQNSIMITNAVLAIFDAFIDLVLFSFVIGVFKIALRFLPFDNYKKPAYKRAGGKFISITIISVLLLAARAVIATFLGNDGSFDSTMFTDTLLGNLDLAVKMLLLAIGIHVLGIVDAEDEVDDVKVAAPKVVDAPAEEAAEEN